MCDCGTCENLPWAKQGIVKPAKIPLEGILFPNTRNIGATLFEVFDIDHPVILESASGLPNGNLFAWPREMGATAQADRTVYEAASGGGDSKVRLLLPYPGIWAVRADSNGAGVYKVLDACNPAFAITGAGLRIVGGNVILNAAPLTMSAPTFATVGAASATAVAANGLRRFISLENTDPANTIYIAWGGNPAVLGSGIPIHPKMGKSWNQPGEDVDRGAVQAIAAVAGVNLAVQEGT